MLDGLLRRLFGSGRTGVAPPPSQAATDGEATEPPPFLQRDRLLDRRQQVAGYLFSIAHPGGPRNWQAASERFFDRALIERLAAPESAGLAGRHAVMAAIRPESLLLDEVAALAPSGAVLWLSGPWTETRPEALLARATHLRGHGLRLACPQAYAGTPLAPLLDTAAFITLDAAAASPADLIESVRHAREAHPETGLIATGVDSVELFDACRRLPFDYYLGRYLTVRREDREPRLNSQRMVVSQLISHLRRKEADYDRLVLIARQDLALTFRLLRYINSPAMGLRSKIGSLRQAMVYIGREGLYRWLTLLLFYNSKSAPADAALRETSLGRGRMCELLAQRRMGRADCEQAFVTGLLSLVDVLFRMPMPQALGHLDLPDDIREALAEHGGRFGPLVALTLACEKGDPLAIADQGGRMGLSLAEVNDLYLRALDWAVEYGQSLDEDPAGPA